MLFFRMRGPSFRIPTPWEKKEYPYLCFIRSQAEVEALLPAAKWANQLPVNLYFFFALTQTASLITWRQEKPWIARRTVLEHESIPGSAHMAISSHEIPFCPCSFLDCLLCVRHSGLKIIITVFCLSTIAVDRNFRSGNYLTFNWVSPAANVSVWKRWWSQEQHDFMGTPWKEVDGVRSCRKSSADPEEYSELHQFTPPL